jgi:hypothetical protein
MMSGYTVLRLVHGYWRWSVLASALVVLARALTGVQKRRAFTRTDERAALLFITALDLQVLLGLVLYFAFSPFWLAARQSFHAILHDPVSRFFGVEHETAMLLALVVAHAGRVRARRLDDGARRHRVMLMTLIVFFALVLWAIPWPWRAAGRPLLRLSF